MKPHRVLLTHGGILSLSFAGAALLLGWASLAATWSVVALDRTTGQDVICIGDTESIPGAWRAHRTSPVAYVLPGFGIADFHFARTRDLIGADHGTRRREERNL